jgi:hypothetical protein
MMAFNTLPGDDASSLQHGYLDYPGMNMMMRGGGMTSNGWEFPVHHSHPAWRPYPPQMCANMPKGVAMGFPGGPFTGSGAEQTYFGSSLAGGSSEGGTGNESRSSDPRSEEMNSKRQPSPEPRPPTPQISPAHQPKLTSAGEPQDIRTGRDDASVSSTAVNDDYIGRYGSHRC